MYENTSRIRQFNEMRMQHEVQTIDLLQKGMRESGEQTKKMTNLLSNFETRLTALHDLIMPVYEATNTLQIKYSNIQKTVTELDKIIEYYDSVKNLSQVIQAGPGKDINLYLSQMNRLKSAIEYFAVNKNQSQKKQNEELWEKGKLSVDREFELLLSKCSDGLLQLAENELDIGKFDETPLPNIREEDVQQMVSIIDWFKNTEPAYLDKLYEKIIRMRSKEILDALDRAKKKPVSSINTSFAMINNSSSGSNLISGSVNMVQAGGAPNKRNSLSANVSMGLNGSPNGEEKKNSLRTKLTDMRRKTLKGGVELGDAHNNASSANLVKLQAQAVVEQDLETTDCLKLVHCVKKSLRIFSVEHKFIGKIISPTTDKLMNSKILERIFDPVLRSFNVDAEKLSNNVKQITNKCTSKYVIGMFCVLTELVKMKPAFLKVFEQSAIITKTNRHVSNSIQQFLEIFIKIERACVQILRDVIDEIKNDPQTIPGNGSIHPVTIDTLTIIENILPFDIIAGFIANVVVSENQNQMLPSEVETNLRREASYANEAKFTQIAYQVNTDSDKQNYRIALAEYMTKLFRWLKMNLNNKAENYMDPNLKWIFLLNNAFKISKLFQESNNIYSSMPNRGPQPEKVKTINELFQAAGKPSLKQLYDADILTYKKEYMKCWSRLINFIKDLNTASPFSDAKLKDKERSMLKDRFSGFNKEFDDIYETQIRYYIPTEQSELADMMRQDNILYVNSQYKKFYETYSNLNFATNKDKYVKYSPELLGARMREFFNAF